MLLVLLRTEPSFYYLVRWPREQLCTTHSRRSPSTSKLSIVRSRSIQCPQRNPFLILSGGCKVDIPGLGARDGEKLTKQAAMDAIADAIKKFGKNGRAVLVGHSMGGFLAMQFGSEHPEMTAGLVLSGCASESSGVGSAAIYGAMGAVYKVFVAFLPDS